MINEGISSSQDVLKAQEILRVTSRLKTNQTYVSDFKNDGNIEIVLEEVSTASTFLWPNIGRALMYSTTLILGEKRTFLTAGVLDLIFFSQIDRRIFQNDIFRHPFLAKLFSCDMQAYRALQHYFPSQINLLTNQYLWGVGGVHSFFRKYGPACSSVFAGLLVYLKMRGRLTKNNFFSRTGIKTATALFTLISLTQWLTSFLDRILYQSIDAENLESNFQNLLSSL